MSNSENNDTIKIIPFLKALLSSTMCHLPFGTRDSKISNILNPKLGIFQYVWKMFDVISQQGASSLVREIKSKPE